MSELKNASSFLKDLITSATEHSKRLTLIDCLTYFILMAAMITLIILIPQSSLAWTDIVLYLTTAHVSLRLGYSFKSGLENFQKIKSSVNNTFSNEEDG